MQRKTVSLYMPIDKLGLKGTNGRPHLSICHQMAVQKR